MRQDDLPSAQEPALFAPPGPSSSERTSWFSRLRRFARHDPWRFWGASILATLFLAFIGWGVTGAIHQHHQAATILDLPELSPQQALAALEEGSVARVIDHTLQDGSLLSPRVGRHVEFVMDGGSHRLSLGDGSISEKVWEELGAAALRHPVAFERGLNQGGTDRVASILSSMLLIGGLLALIVFAQKFAGEMLAGHSFTPVRPDTSVLLDSVLGYEDVKREIRETLTHLRLAPELANQGVRPIRGLLLSGPPGVGKTLMAKALANEWGASFFTATGADFVEMYVGVGPKRVRSLFRNARNSRPAVIFLDEFDAIGSRSGPGQDSERHGTINALLAELDGMNGNDRILVVAATNHPDMIDPALLRPGRFDKRIHIDLPDQATRELILGHYLSKGPAAPGIPLDVVAQRTMGASGAMLANLVQEARRLALRETEGRDSTVTLPLIIQAQETILLGVTERRSDGEQVRRVAFHELGHALVGRLCEANQIVDKVTVVGRGPALGYTVRRPISDEMLRPEPSLRAEIAMLLGGRAAEAILFGNVSSGAADDLERANKIAEAMVLRFGMGQNSGLRVPASGEAPTKGSEEDIRAILEQEYQRAMQIVKEHSEWLSLQGARLMAEGTLEGEDVFSGLEETGSALLPA